VAQVVECLLICKCEALNSNQTKPNQKKKKPPPNQGDWKTEALFFLMIAFQRTSQVLETDTTGL
jgi:hypothetical protein